MANDQPYSARRLTESECRAKGIDSADIPRTILIEHEPSGARAAFTFPDGGPSIEELTHHPDAQRIMKAMLTGFRQGRSTIAEIVTTQEELGPQSLQ